jgi:hypothetical protein
VTPHDIAALIAPAGRLLLDTLPPYDPDGAMRLAEGLRARGIDPALVAAALTQSRLRQRARAKLGPFADGLLFTDAGLQQATRLTVAAHHAQRFLAAGLRRIADLTAGIGIDSLTMASLGLSVTAAESDPTTAAVATFNLRHFPNAEVICGDGLALDLDGAGIEAVYADPSRRTATGQRLFDPAAYTPPLDALIAAAGPRPLGLKIAPGVPHGALPEGCEAQFVSDGGAVVECALWTGVLGRGQGGRTPAHRSALVLRDGKAVDVHHGDTGPLDAGPLGDYLLEPDGAVIRAGLIAEAAALAGLADPRLLHPRIAYVTADAPTQGTASSMMFAAYRVLDVIPFKINRLGAYLRSRDVGELTIKKRGVDVDPTTLRTRLRLKGEERATVVLTRVEGRHSVIVVDPCPEGGSHRATEDVSA